MNTSEIVSTLNRYWRNRRVIWRENGEQMYGSLSSVEMTDEATVSLLIHHAESMKYQRDHIPSSLIILVKPASIIIKPKGLCFESVQNTITEVVVQAIEIRDVII